MPPDKGARETRMDSKQESPSGQEKLLVNLDGDLSQGEKNARLADMYRKLNVPTVPALRAVDGIRYDYNCGLRVWVPPAAKRKYRISVKENDTGLYSCDKVYGADEWLQTKYFWYTDYVLEIADASTGQLLFKDEFNVKGKPVMFVFDVQTIGDVLAWFPAVLKFIRVRGCKPIVALRPKLLELLSPMYKGITFVDVKDASSVNCYATYQMSLSLDGKETLFHPDDWRGRPLHEVAYDILGLYPNDFEADKPKVFCSSAERIVKEPYVCIASMASGGCKLWHNPFGWDKVVDFLKKCGYRVIDIDGTSICGDSFAFQKIPAGAEDWTGTMGEDKSLPARASLIRDCEFFIGLGSGLSWVAWCLDKPVVLISGFSQAFCEFYTPYRVINKYTCHGCFNDPSVKFDQGECFWCPRQEKFADKFICSRLITSRQVVRRIMQIPEFQRHMLDAGLCIEEDGNNYAPRRISDMKKDAEPKTELTSKTKDN